MVNDESGLHLGQFNIVKNLDVIYFCYCVNSQPQTHERSTLKSRTIFHILALNQENNCMRL